MSKEKVVLAYSGGLDTSVCVKWLQDEKNLDVVCVCGNVGQEETGLDAKKQKALEDICVEGDLLKTKIKLEQDWATAVYNGQWYSPLKNALDAFMADTQKFVTGTVRLKFFKGNCHVVGRKSPFSLYDYGLATYDRDTTFDEKASAGFIEIDTLSLKTWAKVQGPSSAAAQA